MSRPSMLTPLPLNPINLHIAGAISKNTLHLVEVVVQAAPNHVDKMNGIML